MSNDEFYVGIDPSLKGNAVVVIDGNGFIHKEQLTSTDVECYLNAEQRILDIFNELKFVVNIINLKLVYVEGLSYMSVSPTLFERCGLLYLITTYLFENDVRYKIIPPTSLKLFITTDGHADKAFIQKVIKCRWGYNFKDDNIADAYGLARMALKEHRC